MTVGQAVDNYLDAVSLSRSVNTSRTYQNGLRLFLQVLKKHGIDPENTLVDQLTEDAVSWFASDLKRFSPATERLYLTAATGFYQFLAAENIASPNLPRVQLLVHQRSAQTRTAVTSISIRQDRTSSTIRI